MRIAPFPLPVAFPILLLVAIPASDYLRAWKVVSPRHRYPGGSMIRILLRPLLGGLLVALLLLGSLQARVDRQRELIGKLAPEIPAADVNIGGKPAKLSDYKGKVVLVHFWAVWCPQCIATIPTHREWQDEYRDKGFVVLAVLELQGRYGAFDKQKGDPVLLKDAPKEKEEEMLRGFAEYHRLNYPVAALVPEKFTKVSDNYWIEGFPVDVLINRKGEIALIKAGKTPDYRKTLQPEIAKLLAEK
jgi:thiol-disulfide isomerase/thioredoxin